MEGGKGCVCVGVEGVGVQEMRGGCADWEEMECGKGGYGWSEW